MLRHGCDTVGRFLFCRGAAGRGALRSDGKKGGDEGSTTDANLLKKVLNAGSGPPSARGVHRAFQSADWREIRLDINPEFKPDIVGTVTDLSEAVAPQSLDAVWASHSLEHLHPHEAPLALAEFRRILKADGFALITSPDLETIATLVIEHGPDHVAYEARVGPITAHDMLYGHAGSIQRGMSQMAHHSGFTCASLARLLLAAGFPIVLAKRLGFDLWALALMEDSDKTAIQAQLLTAGLDMFDHND